MAPAASGGGLTLDIREKLVALFYENNVRCDQKIEGLADDVIDIIAHSITTHEWISVKDRLPELGERVICTDGYAVFEQYRVGLSCVYGMWDRGGLKSPMQEVTHWMPLPQPPKGE